MEDFWTRMFRDMSLMVKASQQVSMNMIFEEGK
jgi:hypothetical protein